MSTRPARSSRMSTKAPTPVSLGTGVSVMLTKIRTKIRQTANQFRRTKRRSSTSTSDSPTPSVILQHPSVSIPVEVTLPYSRPSLSRSSLISLDMVAEEDAWWMRDRQSHPAFVSEILSGMAPLPSPLEMGCPSIAIPWCSLGERPGSSNSFVDEMDITSYLSTTSNASSSISSSEPVGSDNSTSDQGSETSPSPLSPELSQVIQYDDSFSLNSNGAPDDFMNDPDDFNDDETQLPYDTNCGLPYYGAVLIPLPHTPPKTPEPEAECDGVKPKYKQLAPSTSLTYSIDEKEEILSVIISAPCPSESIHHDWAVDQLLQTMAARPAITNISIDVPSCDDFTYGGKLVNDVFSVVQGSSLSLQSLAIRLPLDERVEVHAPLVTENNCPLPMFAKVASPYEITHGPTSSKAFSSPKLLPQWTHLGRLDVSQLSSINISYPFPLDDLMTMVSCSKHLEEIKIDRIIQSRSIASQCPVPLLPNLTSLQLASHVDVLPFLSQTAIPSLRYLVLKIYAHASLNEYIIQWDQLQRVEVECKMHSNVEAEIRELCYGTGLHGRYIKITNLNV